MSFRAVSYQKKLQAAGIDPKVAQAHAEAMEEFVVSELVTKDYLDSRLAQFEAKFDTKLAELRAEVKTEIAALQVSLIRWMIGAVAGGTLAIILTLLRVVQ